MSKEPKNPEDQSSLVGKIVMFSGSLGHQRVSRPYRVISETRIMVVCQLISLDLRKNRVPTCNEIPEPWTDLDASDLRPETPTYVDDAFNTNRRKESILHVTEDINVALALYNASCRMDRNISRYIKQQYREYDTTKVNILSGT